MKTDEQLTYHCGSSGCLLYRSLFWSLLAFVLPLIPQDTDPVTKPCMHQLTLGARPVKKKKSVLPSQIIPETVQPVSKKENWSVVAHAPFLFAPSAVSLFDSLPCLQDGAPMLSKKTLSF